MIELNSAIGIAKENNTGLIINEYIDARKSFIFPVITPNAPDGSTFYYEVNKETGDHGIFDYWGNLMFNPDFSNIDKPQKIKEID